MTFFEYVQGQRNSFFSYCGGIGYEPLTTIFSDFCMIEADDSPPFDKVQELYETVKEQYINAGGLYSADLAIALNLKTWILFEFSQLDSYDGDKGEAYELSKKYTKLYYAFYDECCKRLKDDDLDQFLIATD